MSHRLPLYADTGGTILSDSANSAGAVVERDGNGNIVGTGLASGAPAAAAPAGSAYHSNAGSSFQASTAISGTASLTNASPRIVTLTASGAYNVTLPAAASSQNQWFTFIKTDNNANVPTIKGSGTDTIFTSGGSGNTYAGLTAQGKFISLWCDGTQWWQVG